jgi:hypothetical protein
MMTRSWAQDIAGAEDWASLECVCLFSLLGLVTTMAVLLTSSAETIALVTAAPM